MFISKTSEHAFRILTFMALNNGEIISAQSLYEELQIPKRYLMRLLTELSKAGFISSTRGRNGGYVFARPLNTIFFSEIIDAIEGLSSFEGCILGSTVCPVDKPCPLHHIWENPKQAFLTTVKNTTLGDIKN